MHEALEGPRQFEKVGHHLQIALILEEAGLQVSVRAISVGLTLVEDINRRYLKVLMSLKVIEVRDYCLGAKREGRGRLVLFDWKIDNQ